MTERLDLARAECGALLAIHRAALARLEAMAPGMPASRAFSTGSLVAYNRRAAGMPAAAESMTAVAPEDKGLAAGAFTGPRVAAPLPGVAMPQSVHDLNRAHAGSFSVLGLTPYIVAETIEFEDAGEELASLLHDADLIERLLDPATAARLGPTLVCVGRSEGASFSASVDWTRSRHGGTVAELFFPEGTGLPQFWFEVALAKAKSGRFTVERVRRPVPGPPVKGLKPYRLLDGTLVDLRNQDLGIAWRRLPDRMPGAAPKLAGHTDCYGHGARYDPKSLDKPVALIAVGRHGEALAETTRRPEYPAEYTSLLLSGAVSAFTKFVVGLTELLINQAGGVVSHFATDAIAVPASREGGLWPCPDGRSRMPEGREAVRLLSHDELGRILARLDPLFGYDGRPAWKEVVSC
jgi:hypothetical protein